MFSTSDTIVAIATPPGRGGIGVVRLSGDSSLTIAARLLENGAALEPRRATLTHIGWPDGGERIDHVVATYFPAPHSYTGEHVVELSAHGSPVVLRSIVEAGISAGGRLAEPGEFTLRAFLNGRVDLTQAEAVADLIDSVTPRQARAAFDQLEGTLTRTIAEIDAALFELAARLEASVDFPDEGYHFVDPGGVAAAIDEVRRRTTALLDEGRRGTLVREGIQVVIVGKPNVGKSSLFNALVGASRAIVTDVPGTTRDLVTEVVDLEGLRATLVDTAGRRHARDPIEAEGVERSLGAQSVADLVLVVIDGSQVLDAADHAVLDETRGVRRLIVCNKIDCGRSVERVAGERLVDVSAKTGHGVAALRHAIVCALDAGELRDRPAMTNVRHIALVGRADNALARAHAAIEQQGGSLSEEFVLADLQEARQAIEEISGKRVADDVLEHIFARFCIGK